MNRERRPPLIPLHALRAFEMAARVGSFKTAAAELGVTPAAISHQVKGLEAHLGLLLFERLHRALRLTPAGERLAIAARDSFVGLERAVAELGEQGAPGRRATLNVTAAPSIAAKWLAPRLHRFEAECPWIEMRLDASDRRADIARDPGVDVALRYGAGPHDAALRAVPLWLPGTVIAVCAPSLVAAGRLGRPEDILEHSLLRTVQPSLPGEDSDGIGPLSWESWLAAAGVASRPVKGPLFGSTHLALEAALAGKGLALAPFILVEEDMERGRLVQPFPIALPDPFSYWLLFRADRADERGIRAFARWLGKEAGP